MDVQIFTYTIISVIIFAFHVKLSSAENATKIELAFSWLDDKDTFKAGEIATIKIKVLSNFDKLDKNAFKPILSVNDKVGNSSIVSGVFINFEDDPENLKIFFTTVTAGLFNVLITEDRFQVLDSSLHFTVEPGKIYPSVCVAFWVGYTSEFEAGSRVRVVVLPKDAFGNLINSSKEDTNSHNFTVSVFYGNDSIADVPNIITNGWDESGHIIIDFILVKSGIFFLNVQGDNQTLIGSPLPFKVNPGPLDVSNCVAKWTYEPNAWQLFSKMEIFVHQHDHYRNLVPGLIPFDAEVVEKETNLSIPLTDLYFEQVETGIQLFSFTNLEPGNFMLTISDMKHNKSISNMPFSYTVFVGYCNGSNSVVNGSGLNNSIAGETMEFSVYLNDIYNYPSPVEVERLQVQIVKENDSYNVQPSIYPLQTVNDSQSVGRIPNTEHREIAIAPAPSPEANDSSMGHLIILAASFNVVYTPAKSGIYGIHVFCGNILLCGYHPFRKQVASSVVNVSVSGVVKFAPKVPKMIKNEVVVQLMDSFQNPVLSQQSKLKLENVSNINSGFSSWPFVDNNDGSYTGQYLFEHIGTCEMCASFDGKRLSPCPFAVNVYSSEYFPRAYNDTVSVWEDESIAFDILANDYFAGDNATILQFSQASRGSLLQYGSLLRYTPHKDYYGNDSFVYTMSDINGNLATAFVNISVLTIPPQFVSFPSQLQAAEDMISPQFGGFTGFEIRYSDMKENISVNISSISGSFFLSSMLMLFWSEGNELFVHKGEEKVKGLILEGTSEVVNHALQSIQYLGNENFYGGDTIRISTKNKNGVQNLDVPIFVDPINDPPFINFPELIMLKSDEEESLIYDSDRDHFEFSIGDPDLQGFPGGDAFFMVTFSVEVNEGFLVTSLPAKLINTIELRMNGSYQWQPVQTYVTISKHFTVKANGIRFQGTIIDCNNVLKHLNYHGGEHGAVLTLTVSDMGNYGCYQDCVEKVSMPLYTEATINLIRRRPMSTFVAHTLGSAIVIESIMVFSLGLFFTYFTCKCAFLLVNDRKSNATYNWTTTTTTTTTTTVEPVNDNEHILQKGTWKRKLPESGIRFLGYCSKVLSRFQKPTVQLIREPYIENAIVASM